MPTSPWQEWRSSATRKTKKMKRHVLLYDIVEVVCKDSFEEKGGFIWWRDGTVVRFLSQRLLIKRCILIDLEIKCEALRNLRDTAAGAHDRYISWGERRSVSTRFPVGVNFGGSRPVIDVIDDNECQVNLMLYIHWKYMEQIWC